MNKTAKKVVATILTTVMTVGAATVVSADDLSITLLRRKCLGGTL